MGGGVGGVRGVWVVMGSGVRGIREAPRGRVDKGQEIEEEKEEERMSDGDKGC